MKRHFGAKKGRTPTQSARDALRVTAAGPPRDYAEDDPLPVAVEIFPVFASTSWKLDRSYRFGIIALRHLREAAVEPVFAASYPARDRRHHRRVVQARAGKDKSMPD